MTEEERQKVLEKLFQELKRVLPKHVFLSFDGILIIDWDKLYQDLM